MPEDKSEVLRVDMEVGLPDLLDGPIKRADGTVFSAGDKVRHKEIGVGTVVRICQYQTVGLALYIDFVNGQDEIIGIDHLEKVEL
jgi:hypothetical protein